MKKLKIRDIKNPATGGTFYYLDGLVSTGKRISLHNIKNNFFYQKKIFNIFYAHFIKVVEKALRSRITSSDPDLAKNSSPFCPDLARSFSFV